MNYSTSMKIFAEENSDLSDEGCNSLATNLPSRHIDNKKDIKFSQMTQKTISHEIRGLRLEHKKRYETSIFLCGEEKSSDFSGEKKFRRKKSLQVQLHTERTEMMTMTLTLFLKTWQSNLQLRNLMMYQLLQMLQMYQLMAWVIISLDQTSRFKLMGTLMLVS
ncbi:EF-hand calcium-binding domain-containing protein 13-like isoform X3 [Lynx rufus]|uniref:EF-hand calcium-binding domain-containing protein 13-like isoform X3 n=1 Tax=Lynx rufus TaxID=61384 RepID=UPI001F123D6E|nr:EF-hand calcium-binding domain-containing protein 13-like isoform X3 [Lynx rufus]